MTFYSSVRIEGINVKKKYFDCVKPVCLISHNRLLRKTVTMLYKLIINLKADA